MHFEIKKCLYLQPQIKLDYDYFLLSNNLVVAQRRL